MTPSSYLAPLAALLLILALIPVSLWLLKRTPLGGFRSGGAGSGAALRLVATLPLSPSQRLVTVEVGAGEDKRWLVLGVSAAGIQALHTLPPQAEAATATPPGALPRFAQLLQRQRDAAPAASAAPGAAEGDAGAR